MATDIVTRTGKAAALSAADNDQNLESLSGTVDSKVADYTVLYTDQNKTIEFNRATAVTCTLDAIATILAAIDTTSFRVKIKNIGAGVCTIDGNGAETIDGSATIALGQYDSAELQITAAGTAWSTINRHIEKKFVNNANGNPNISDTWINIDTVVARNAWESIGPTAPGTADNIWTALDSVPVDSDWIECNVIYQDYTGTTPDNIHGIVIYARGGDSAETIGADNRIGYCYSRRSTSAIGGIGGMSSGVKIPLNSDNEFDIYWNANSGDPDGDAFITMTLVGYGSNG